MIHGNSTMVAGLAAGSCAALVVGLVSARRRYVVVTVAGDSMLPTLRPGDRILVRRCGARGLTTGSLIVFREPPERVPVPAAPGPWPPSSGAPGPWPPSSGAPGPRWVIKRLVAVPGDAVPGPARPAVAPARIVPPGMIVAFGDGSRSRDSRHWGFIPADRLLGVVVRRLRAEASARSA